MLNNPFTPSEIASLPEDFFGRAEELDLLERSIAQGSVAILGTIGIGKSSLLAHARLRIEGFASRQECDGRTILAVGDRDIKTIDHAANLLLERLITIDETRRQITIAVPKVLEWKSEKVYYHFKEGHSAAVLEHVLEKMMDPDAEPVVLCIDEADKCPVPLARLIRKTSTYLQLKGIKNVRFLLAGVSPFYRRMIEEDAGVARFIYKVISVKPLPEEEAVELLESKLKEVAKEALGRGINLTLDDDALQHAARLSGGHPHLLQLLGSHLVEHENQDPDNVIDKKDLVSALTTICYQDRAPVYESLIHKLDVEGKLIPLNSLFTGADSTCPTRISRKKAEDTVDTKTLQWFIDNDILLAVSSDEYSLTDEFLRIRMIMDEDRDRASDVERQVLNLGYEVSEIPDINTFSWPLDWQENEEYEDEEW